ncbi:MAG: hypothetical protein AAGC65_10675 [Mucilaginibacter sp.]|uniref:hypothetical protein n=1 Tax=Mucilaginibacter sp. TaxID=1882438 RepID=UPI0031B34B83
MKTPVAQIDEILHAERITDDNSKITFEDNLTTLPDGTFIILNAVPYLLKSEKLYRWNPAAYDPGMLFPEINKVQVLTPKSLVRMYHAGYIPQMAL